MIWLSSKTDTVGAGNTSMDSVSMKHLLILREKVHLKMQNTFSKRSYDMKMQGES